jgi:predicted porin
VTWRPRNNLTLVSRYDFQLSTIDTKADFLSEVTDGKRVSHIFSQSATWSPISRLFLQGSVNYTRDETETPADNLVPGSSPVNRLVLKSKNNYWNASLTAGYALDDKTDLQAQYFYYRADDYSNNSNVSQPYGADGEEHGVTVTLARQMTKALRWTLRYGYFRYRDDLYGGNNDYDAHLVYSSVQYRF